MQPSFQTRFAAVLAHRKAGRLPEAARLLETLAVERPNVPEIPFHQGQVATELGDYDAAIAFLTSSLTLKPGEPAILTSLAKAQTSAGRIDDAVASYDTLIKRAPSALQPRADKALMLQHAGRFDDAETEFRKALKRAPNEGQLYRIFLATKKLSRGDPLIATMRRAWADKKVKGMSRAHLGFALAKAMEDSGQHDQVFRFLSPANRIVNEAQPFDMEARVRELSNLRTAFATLPARRAAAEGFSPIFVAGLPRSGTTLVEQIIASHPDVTGGGEMRHGLATAYEILGNPAVSQLAPNSLTAQALERFASGYEAAVRRTHSFETSITDKSIQSHLIFGLIYAALPNARIVVVRRDPRDIGLSIYKNVFGPGTHRYAYDLETIAQYIKGHDDMLAFWKERMGDALHEVWYEDLVADPEPQARALIDAAGLDWNDACLKFHENRREVKTLSVHQVRQPIYKGSAKAWTRYEKELAPLINALGLSEGKSDVS